MFLIDIFDEIVFLFLEMAPYLIIGLLFVGILHILITKEMILKYVGKNTIGSVLKASILGVPLPLCSCGVIPTSVYMTKSGASKGSVVSFLISTPQTGIDSIVATYGMMGWVFGAFRPIAALIMGIFGGVIVRFMDSSTEVNMPEKKKKMIEIPTLNNSGDSCKDDDCESCGPGESKDIPKGIIPKMKKMFNYSMIEFLDDIAPQFIVGLIISGLIAYFIPEGFFSNSAFDDGLLGMFLMILVGAPMYVCATGSIPIAVTLMMKGFSPGVAFVFLAVGPATNAASFTILLNVLGKKTAFIYLAAISFSSVVMGLLLDKIFRWLSIDPSTMLVHSHDHDVLFNDNIKLILGIIFFILLSGSIYRKYIKGRILNKEKKMAADKIEIEGMSCNHCVTNVKNAINKVKGVEKADVVLNDNAAYIEGNYDIEKILNEIKAVGYTAKKA